MTVMEYNAYFFYFNKELKHTCTLFASIPKPDPCIVFNFIFLHCAASPTWRKALFTLFPIHDATDSPLEASVAVTGKRICHPTVSMTSFGPFFYLDSHGLLWHHQD